MQDLVLIGPQTRGMGKLSPQNRMVKRLEHNEWIGRGIPLPQTPSNEATLNYDVQIYTQTIFHNQN